jgi:hypothetical protein
MAVAGQLFLINIITAIKSRHMGWVGQVACTGEIGNENKM